MKTEKLKNYIIAALVIVIVVIGLVWIRDFASEGKGSKGSAASNVRTSADVSGSGSGAGAVSSVSTEGNYFMGEEDAPVTLIEFIDFQCPFCRKFWRETLEQIDKDYIKTGKVKFVAKDFPLDNIHPGATPAALATRCAGDQGKFWEMHDKIFEGQDKQGQGTISFGESELREWAAELGLDMGKFNKCFDEQEHLSEVRQDLLEGQQAGITGTPGFLLNGKLISGAQPYAVFKQAIENELAKAG